jgi:RNA polymerase sigma-70 factor (ECF subfamily)
MTGAGPKDARGAAHAMNEGRAAASDSDAVRASEDPDLVLVQRTQRGDQAGFRALFDKYHRRVFAIALGVVKSPQDAHDIVQEAFVRVHRHLGGFQGSSSFYTWLYRITMNLAIDHHRRTKHTRHVDYDDAIGRDEAELQGAGNIAPVFNGADPHKTQARKELAARMQAALRELPPHHQQVIVLREVDGLSYEEIANVMKVPKGTVMSRLFHARRKMQAALADYVSGVLTPQDQREQDEEGNGHGAG